MLKLNLKRKTKLVDLLQLSIKNRIMMQIWEATVSTHLLFRELLNKITVVEHHHILLTILQTIKEVSHLLMDLNHLLCMAECLLLMIELTHLLIKVVIEILQLQSIMPLLHQSISRQWEDLNHQQLTRQVQSIPQQLKTSEVQPTIIVLVPVITEPQAELAQVQSTHLHSAEEIKLQATVQPKTKVLEVIHLLIKVSLFSVYNYYFRLFKQSSLLTYNTRL